MQEQRQTLGQRIKQQPQTLSHTCTTAGKLLVCLLYAALIFPSRMLKMKADLRLLTILTVLLMGSVRAVPISIQPTQPEFKFITQTTEEGFTRVFPVPPDAFLKMTPASESATVSYQLDEAPAWLTVQEHVLYASLNSTLVPGIYPFKMTAHDSKSGLSAALNIQIELVEPSASLLDLSWAENRRKLQATTIAPTQTRFQFELQQQRIETFVMPGNKYVKPTPAGQSMSITYILNAGAPAWLSVTGGTTLRADGTLAPAGQYSFSMTATDSISSLTTTLNMLINVRKMVVTYKDVYNLGSPGYDNCGWGGIDGKFLYYGVSGSTKCCYHSISFPGSWYNVQFPSPKLLDTVLFINRDENGNDARITTAVLRAGNSPLPSNNDNCTPSPMNASGLYSCGPRVVSYLGIYQYGNYDINFCQLRAYSYAANAASPTVYHSNTDPAFAGYATKSILNFVNQRLDSNIYNPILAGSSSTYIEIRFPTDRYFHYMTVIGLPVNNYAFSINWLVTVGSNTGASVINNKQVGGFVNSDFDQYGKEILVMESGSVIAVVRTDGQPLALRWIGVFSTATDCSEPFDWSESTVPTQFEIQTTPYTVSSPLRARIGDCGVFCLFPDMSDGSPLPSFITYSGLTLQFSISTGTPVGTYTIRNTCQIDDGVTQARSSTQYFTFIVFNCISSQINEQTWPTQTIQLNFSDQVYSVFSQPYHTDTAGVLFSLPEICGAKTYTTDYTWLEIATADPLGSVAYIVNSNSPAFAGTYTATVSVRFLNMNYLAALDQTFEITLLHPCKETVISTSQTIDPIYFIFGGSAVVTPFTAFTDSQSEGYNNPGLCQLSYQIDANTYGVSVVSSSLSIVIETLDSSLKGTSTVFTLTANATPQQTSAGPALSVTFHVVDCISSQINEQTWPSSTIQLSFSELSYSVFSKPYHTDTAGVLFSLPEICGAKTYTTDQTWLEIATADPLGSVAYIVNSNSPAFAGTYTATVSVRFLNMNYLAALDQTFEITLLHPCKETVISTSQTIEPIYFIFGGSAVVTPFTAFTDSQSEGYNNPGLCQLSYQIDANAYGVSVTSSPLSIVIETLDSALKGTSIALTLTANANPQQTSAGPALSITFHVVNCSGATISLGSQTIADMTSIVLGNADTQIFEFATYTTTPEYSISNICGGLSYSVNPSSILSVDGSTGVITLSSSNMLDIGVYTATLSATLTDHPDAVAATKTFTATLVDPCLTTSIPDFTLPTMSIVLNAAAVSQPMSSFFSNTVAQSLSTPDLCGTSYDVSISPQLPFLSYLNGEITGTNSDNAALGSFSVTVTISLGSYCSTSTTLTVISTCTMEAPTGSVASAVIKVGLDSMPYLIPFTQPASVQACAKTASMTSSPVSLSNGSFVSLSSNTPSGGFISLNNLTLSQAGMYTITLTNTDHVLGTIFDTTVTVIIEDACKTAVFQLTPYPIQNMEVFVVSSEIVSQPFKILTDVELAVPSTVCPIVASIDPVSTFISVDSSSTEILVDAGILTSLIPQGVTSYTFSLQVSSQRFPSIAETYSFALNVTCAFATSIEVVSNNLTDVSYEIVLAAIDPIFIDLPTYRCIPCLDLAYSRTLVLDAAPEFPLPTFIESQDAFGIISLNITNPADIGSYVFRVIARESHRLDGPVNSDVSFRVTLKLAPDYYSEFFYVMPQVQNSSDNQTANNTQSTMSEALSFVLESMGNMMNETQDIEERFNITEVVSNSTNQTSINDTQAESEQNEVVSNSTNQTNINETQAESVPTEAGGIIVPEAEEQSVAVDIPETVKTHEPVQVQVSAVATQVVPKIPVKPSWSKPSFNTSEDAPPEIFSMQMKGAKSGFYLYFSVPMNFSELNDPSQLFDVTVVPYMDARARLLEEAESDTRDMINFNWTLQTTSSKDMSVTIGFSDPYDISVGNKVHMVKFRQKDGSLLESQVGVKMEFMPEVAFKLPAQIADSDVNLAQSIMDVSKTTTLSSMLVTILMGVLLIGSLNTLFSMVGSLQYILYLSLLNTKFPGNCNAVFNNLLTIMCFDLVPDRFMEPWYAWISKYTSDQDISDVFSQRFGQMGYQSSNWVVNLGSAIIFIVTMFVLKIVLPIFTLTRILHCRRSCRKLKGKMKNIQQGLHWNQVIRFFLELSFELTLICSMRAYTYDKDTGYEKIFTYSAIAVLGALVLFTYAIALLIVNNRPYLAKHGKFKKEREALERKYGTVWEDIDVHKRIGVMSTPYFMMSRFFFVMALIFYQDVVIFQLVIVTALALVQIWFAGRRPFVTKKMNNIEIMNQSVAYVVTVMFFELTDHIANNKTRYMFGWVIIGVVCFFIAVNIMLQLIDVFKPLIEQSKRLYIKWKRARQQQQRQDQDPDSGRISFTDRPVFKMPESQEPLRAVSPHEGLLIPEPQVLLQPRTTHESLLMPEISPLRPAGLHQTSDNEQPRLLRPVQPQSHALKKASLMNLEEIIGEETEKDKSSSEDQWHPSLLPPTKMDLDLDTSIDIPRRDTNSIVIQMLDEQQGKYRHKSSFSVDRLNKSDQIEEEN